MASSHSGEDVHVRTIQAMYRRIGMPQAVLVCGSDATPLDALTAARLARDGERPSQVRHMCSGQHSVLVLLAKMGGWELETYWQAEHPAHQAYADAVAAMFDVAPTRLRGGIDGCGILTYAFSLREIAKAYAALADPSAIPRDDRRAALAHHLEIVRDAMLAHPELVGGTRDRLDTSLMKAAPGRIVSKSGMEALRGVGILRGPRGNGRPCRPPAWPSRSKMGMGTAAGSGRPRSRPSGRRACSRGRRSASSPAITGRWSSIRTAGPGPRRSPTSSSCRWAS